MSAKLLVRIASALRQEDGATAVEYAIMAGFIAAVVAAVVFAIGQRTLSEFANFNALW